MMSSNLELSGDAFNFFVALHSAQSPMQHEVPISQKTFRWYCHLQNFPSHIWDTKYKIDLIMDLA